MKWPETLTLIRHDESGYNRSKKEKESDVLYSSFKRAYNKNPDSDEARRLAIDVVGKYSVLVGDHNTPLAPDAGWQAKEMAQNLKLLVPIPDIIFVSPYERTHRTLDFMKEGWSKLNDVRVIEEERIREQEHGLALLYSDWRVFNVLHPEQRKLRNLQGPYWYRYPQGENVPDVRERLRSWQTTLTRDYHEQKVMGIMHHLAILSLRANLERLDERQFRYLDEKEKPINAGVTIYRGKPEMGNDGKLVLDAYNVKLYGNNTVYLK